MDPKKEQIERKLIELESAVDSEPPHSVSLNKPSTDVTANAGAEIKSDLCFFGGLISIALGLLLLFQHVRVGTGFLAGLGFGGQGFGLLLIPLIIGIGWIMYDAKSRAGWAIVSLTCIVIFFSILSGLIMTFPTTSLLGLIFMLLPFALGGMLLFRGLGGPQGVREKLKKEGLIK
jgi:hypothetical protein